MGNINNMRNVANSDRSMKSYVMHKNIKEKRTKPRLKIEGIKDIATLLGPNAKKYKLSHNQRNFQLAGRTTIAALAAALTISGGIAYQNVHSANANSTQYSSETQTLDKDEVLSYAENRLMTIVYKDKLLVMDNANVSYPPHNDRLNTDTIAVVQDIKSPNGPLTQYSYTRYNNPDDQYLNRKSNNNPKITELLNLMIDVYNNPNPSQEDLENLENVASKLQLNNFVLDGNNIVTEAEKDSDFEIGD